MRHNLTISNSDLVSDLEVVDVLLQRSPLREWRRVVCGEIGDEADQLLGDGGVGGTEQRRVGRAGEEEEEVGAVGGSTIVYV